MNEKSVSALISIDEQMAGPGSCMITKKARIIRLHICIDSLDEAY